MARMVSGFIAAWLLVAGVTLGEAQSCFTSSDMPPATLSSLRSAAESYMAWARSGNTSALQPATEFNLADVLATNRELLSGQAKFRAAYLLQNEKPEAHTEFYCGVYNSPSRVAFAFSGLAAGRYGIVLEDISGKHSAVVSWILHQATAEWKIAGLYIRPTESAGHDASWYINQARAYKTKGEGHNAWLYLLAANDLMRPFPAMTDPALDKLYDEIQAAKPADMPAGSTTDLMVAGHTYKLLELFPTAADDHLDLVVRYQVGDILDTSKAFQDNMTVIKALVGKYPELRQAFTSVVARAVAPNGQDYGSLLSMKDVK